ncbi:MAG: hypothetical protein GY906_04950 [bacterium]|nr:hypothetical protein [bacterium]
MTTKHDYNDYLDCVSWNEETPHEGCRDDDRFDAWEGDDDWAEMNEWYDSIEKSIRDDLDSRTDCDD